MAANKALGLVLLPTIGDFVVMKVAPHNIRDHYRLRTVVALRYKARDSCIALGKGRIRSHTVDSVTVGINEICPGDVRACCEDASVKL